ncbi:hypothetical protein M758_4G050900 [Ceratodon purpureus]|nr:hypothetical protein M758_4G050900 [Ceratodon purpureus]
MNHVHDVAKDMAKVATGVGLVVAATIRGLRFRDIGSFAFQTLKGFTDSASRIAGLNKRDSINDFVSSNAEFQDLREVQGRRRNRRNYSSPSWRSIDNFEVSHGFKNHQEKKSNLVKSAHAQRDDSQPEELFVPKKAKFTGVLRPFKSQVDLVEQSLSKKVSLLSVTSHFAINKLIEECSPHAAKANLYL